MVAKLGSDNVYKMQNDYYNKRLADIVMNKLELDKIIEADGKLIQKKDPIFMKPTSILGRAQFYTSEKNLFGYNFQTYWFNIIVIWLGTFLMYIALLFNWLKKIIKVTENLSFGKKNKMNNEVK